MEDELDGKLANGRTPGRFYVHSRFPFEDLDGHNPSLVDTAARFALQVFDENEELEFESADAWELVLRETPKRQQLKALFFEDPRKIHTLAFQKFNKEGKSLRSERFTLRGAEVDQLMAFLALVQSKRLDLNESEDGLRILPGMIRSVLADDFDMAEFLLTDGELLAELIQSDVTAPDVVAVARRRSGLATFEMLLSSESDFEDYATEMFGHVPQKRESVWQHFLEENKWVLGVGSAPQFLHALGDSGLEQVTVGADMVTPGKRPDAVLSTAAAIRALVLVEIKHDNTELLRKTPYRSGVWGASGDLTNSVAQLTGALEIGPVFMWS